MRNGRREDKPDTGASTRRRLLSDGTLVKRAQRELPYATEAFERLMQRYNVVIYRTCRRLLADHSDAEDATQEIMLRVFHGLAGFEARAKFKTWLFRIVYNVCHTRWQHRARETEFLRAYEQVVATQVSDDANRFEVDHLLQQLSDIEREIVTLRFIAGLSLREIADILDVTLSAAKMRLYRAIEKLRPPKECT
ncbi:MAG: sigma-70 family RNA polymerase sigma factor [Gammaproteobacteria bacterium]|nr:sigma-70 family RNA polymerase sigma factor [Gammaproteobacteria bacterium]